MTEPSYATGWIENYCRDLKGDLRTSGTIFITPEIGTGRGKRIKDPAGNAVLSGEFIRVKLSADDPGHYKVRVPAWAATTDPNHFTWQVQERFSDAGGLTVTGIRVDAGQTVQIADISPADPVLPQYAAQVSRDDLQAVIDRVQTLEDDSTAQPALTPDPAHPGFYLIGA